jgi:two-component SAPR family response regulator
MSELSGLRLLLVEDESHVAMLVEDMLADMGCHVVASVARVSEALKLIEAMDIDAAVLDVNVAGEKVFPVAEKLRELAIPFVFATGYGADGVREDLRIHPVVAKPFPQSQLEMALMKVIKQQ